MTLNEMREFLELSEKATEGPWISGAGNPCRDFTKGNWYEGVADSSYRKGIALTGEENDPQSATDAGFIAESRTIAPLAVAKLIEAAEMLRDVEWVDCDCFLTCPCCGMTRKKGHSQYCDLAKFLSKFEEVQDDPNNQK